MKIITTLLTFLFSFQLLHAQILDSHNGNQYHSESIFNADFIKKNKIRKITGKISLKREMQPIRHEGTVEQFTFNQNGMLEEKLSTFKMRGGQIDTTQDYFSYNDLEHLTSQTSYTLSGYNSVKYKYNSEGQRIQEIYIRGENKSQYSYQLDKGQETILKDEQFSFTRVNDSTEKKIYLNSAGKPYKETIISRNSLDQKYSEHTKFYLTRKKQSVTYKYDVTGRLIKILDYSNLLGVQTSTRTFDFDDYGNLYSSKVYKNGKLTHTIEYLYYVQTFLLKAQLTKDESNNSIKITQYSYEYF